MKTAFFINLHKILIIPIVVGLMFHFDNGSTEAFVYLSLHGTYSLLWLVKHALYPDRRFDEKVPAWAGLPFIFAPLAGYYIAPYLLISRHVELAPWLLGLALTLYVWGIFLHYVSDAQKYYVLKFRKGLIDDGLFSRTRNPNYLGEILIYSAYATLSLHWLPFLILGGWVLGFFVRNMIKKDRSLSRYPQFAEYKRRTGLLLPKPW